MPFSPGAEQAESGQMTRLSHQELLGKQNRGTTFKSSVSASQQFAAQRHLGLSRSLQVSRRPSRRRRLMVLSDRHRPPTSEVRPCFQFHLLAREIRRETPSIRKHSKGRKAANFSTGFVVTRFHFIGFYSFWFSRSTRLWCTNIIFRWPESFH